MTTLSDRHGLDTSGTDGTTGVTGAAGRWSVLSCYTAALAAYLDDTWPGSGTSSLIARSARLAVQVTDDTVRFSHHRVPLHHLPSGEMLEHAGADSRGRGLDGVAAELGLTGRVLVVTRSARLPWSVADPAADAPHLLLLDGRRPGPGWGEWHAVDHFAGVLPSGAEQEPFAGWIGTDDLLAALSCREPFAPEQERRTAMMFGFPVETEPATYRWLRRAVPWSAAPVRLSGPWHHEPRDVWRELAPIVTDPDRAALVADDLWAASQHHRHRIDHARSEVPDLSGDLLDAADDAWAQLPQKLRLAEASARRGRPRAGMVAAAVDELACTEQVLVEELDRHGWTETHP